MMDAARRCAALVLLVVMTVSLGVPAWALGGCAYGHDQVTRPHHGGAMTALHAMHGDEHAHHNMDHATKPQAPAKSAPEKSDCGDHCAMVVHCLAACMNGVFPLPTAGAALQTFALDFTPMLATVPAPFSITPEPHPPRLSRI